MVKPVTQMLDTRSLASKQSKYEAEDDVIVKADLGTIYTLLELILNKTFNEVQQ